MNIFTVRRSLDNKEKLNLNHRKEFRHRERVYENVKANSHTIHEFSFRGGLHNFTLNHK